MEDFYWIGYSIALILEVLLTFYGLVILNSVKAKNFLKVGLYYSLSQLNFIEGDKPGFFKQTVGVISRLIINPFLSWLDIGWQIIRLGMIINQKISTPEKVKEVHYKLGATILSKEEVKSLIKQSVSYLGKNIEFEDDKLILEDDSDGYGWYADVQVNTNKKQLVFYSHSPDYDEYYSTYEYKIENNRVYTKILEERTKNIGENEYYDVKDGVILEDDITERAQDSALLSSRLEEQILKLNNQLDWNDDLNYKVKYFVLSKHPEIITVSEFKKICRSEIERLKKGHKKHEEIYAKYNITITYNEEEAKYEYDYKEKEVDLDALRDELNNVLKKIHCTSDEVSEYSFDERISTLESYINCKD